MLLSNISYGALKHVCDINVNNIKLGIENKKLVIKFFRKIYCCINLQTFCLLEIQTM